MIARAPETFACEWDIDESGFGVCKTRKRLKDAVVRATRMRSGEVRTVAYQNAVADWASHECEKVPVVDRGVGQECLPRREVGDSRDTGTRSAPEAPAPSPTQRDLTIEDIGDAAKRYGRLCERAAKASDLTSERDDALRALLAKVEIYRAEASRDGARAHFQRLLREVEHG